MAQLKNFFSIYAWAQVEKIHYMKKDNLDRMTLLI